MPRRWRLQRCYRTWPVRLEAMELTESVRSFRVPATPGHHGLASEFAVGTHFAGHARDFGGEDAKLLDHRVDDAGAAQELAFERSSVHIQAHSLGQISLGNSGDGARHLSSGAEQVLNQGVDARCHLVQEPRRAAQGWMRSRVLPSLPTACPTRFSSSAIC